jgi:NitT/TauT family transport system ATP-binding protein
VSTPKVQVDGLSKTYPTDAGPLEVLRDITLTVRAGEFVSIVGASGCGKTTLMRLVDGLIQPSHGTVAVDGKPITKPGPAIAFVFQQDGLLPWRTVLDNVILGPELHGRNLSQARKLGKDLLALVGLKSFDRHYPHELSGGMRQRVNLARALAAGSDVLLMDEPFASLDAQTREIMQVELMRIVREAGKTVLFVTHQIDEAIYLSDRVLVFTVRPGRLKEEILIDLPKPRELHVKRTPAFASYTAKIWSLIEEEVKEAIRIEVESVAQQQ